MLHAVRTFHVLVSAIFLFCCAARATAQCPAVGNDTVCGMVITVTDAGISISATGQGPYNTAGEGGDSSVGSLVGVINNSSLPISTLGLGSPLGIFVFTGDGIDNYGVQGNALDTSGYGGPNAYFSDFDYYRQQGTVHFITPIAPGGGTSYFSLANNLASATSCSDAINGAVTTPRSSGTDINSTVTPNKGMTLNQAASLCGFTSFNWQQLVTNLPQPSPYYTADFSNLVAPIAFNDPPPNGYSYQYPDFNAVLLPVYYNIFTLTSDPLSLAANTNTNTLSFYDSPADPCLDGSVLNSCGYTAPPGSVLSFSTHLVGVTGTDANATVQDTGIGFTWNDNFNGTSGGVAVLNVSHPVDPHSGTGGVSITGYNPYTSFRYPKSLAVSTVNSKAAGPATPARLLGSPQIVATASGLAYSRTTKTFTGSITIKNMGSSVLSGPLQVVLLALTQGTTLTNATGSFTGSPYITVAGISSLAPGASCTVPLRFNDPSLTTIRFSPAIYTGGFN